MQALHALPEATVITDPDLLAAYRQDESHVVGPLPLAVVKPRGLSALKGLVKLATENRWALTPRGTGTGKAGGCTPLQDRPTLVLDMTEWPGDIKVNKADACLWAPVSASLKEVKAAAEAEGLFYPPDPNSWDQCSFGGTLATNAGGPSAAKYGMTRHYVLSIDAVMADGEKHRFGIATVKNNAGPNLAQLLVGSEGLFGILVGATVRLIPRPTELMTLLLPVEDWEALLALPGHLISKGFLPSAFEFWDPAVLALLREHGSVSAKGLPGKALALLEFDDQNCTSDDFLSRLMDVLGPLGTHAQSATEARQREQLWTVRRQTSTLLKERFPHKISEDIVVPRSQLNAFYEGVHAQRIPVVSYGHLGDGNLHVNFLHAGETPAAEMATHIDSLLGLCIRLGGTVSGEHGIGIAKRMPFLTLSDPFLISSLRGIKGALDPADIFNPGKVI